MLTICNKEYMTADLKDPVYQKCLAADKTFPSQNERATAHTLINYFQPRIIIPIRDHEADVKYASYFEFNALPENAAFEIPLDVNTPNSERNEALFCKAYSFNTKEEVLDFLKEAHDIDNTPDVLEKLKSLKTSLYSPLPDLRKIQQMRIPDLAQNEIHLEADVHPDPLEGDHFLKIEDVQNPQDLLPDCLLFEARFSTALKDELYHEKQIAFTLNLTQYPKRSFEQMHYFDRFIGNESLDENEIKALGSWLEKGNLIKAVKNLDRLAFTENSAREVTEEMRQGPFKTCDVIQSRTYRKL